MKTGGVIRFCAQASLLAMASAQASLRRWGHSVAVVGDYLYIDGGEITRTVSRFTNGSADTSSTTFNDTLSLPLASSWTNSSLTLKTTRKTAPVFNRASLWTSNGSVYMWGGQGPFDHPPKGQDLWRFKTDGAGGGSWSIQEPSNKDVFLGLKRTTGAASAVCGDVGFHLGGLHSPATDPNIKGRSLTPGLLSYDMGTRTWTNQSAVGYNNFGTSVYGSATCVSNFGKKGLFLPLGGAVASSGAYKGDGSELMDLETVKFYDLSSDTWYSQLTSGEVPRPRSRFCVAGAVSANNTYEMYMYGGVDRNDNPLSDLWILSIPAFTWLKVQVASPPRTSHACAIVGKSFIAIGGLGKNLSFSEPEEWSQGIGVFDTSTLTWADGYEGSQILYDQPHLVQNWYKTNNIEAVSWTNDEVKNLFLSTENTTIPYQNPNGEASKSGPPLGAIIGGTIGGVVGLMVVFVLVWMFLRRRRRHAEQSPPPQELDPTQVEKLPPIPSPSAYSHELASPTQTPELAGVLNHGQQLPVYNESHPAELDSYSPTTLTR